MNKIKLLLLFSVLLSFTAKTQTYTIDTSEISFENKLRPCLFVSYDADARTVKKAWSDFVKKNYGIKTKGIGLFSDNDIVTSEDVTIGAISDKRMNMYVSVANQPAGSELKYFMSFGYDFFIGPAEYGEEFAGMKKVLNDFSVQFLNDYYKDETNAILKKLKQYEKDIRSNEKSMARNDKKAAKGSEAEASGMEARNNALKNENTETENKILDLQVQLEGIKNKQAGITRN